VKCADLATSYDSIDLDTCYTNFRCKINVYCDVHESTVAEFLRAQFPDFELELNKENGIPKCDAVYVFSLMLYFSCIRHPIPYFQNIGKEFDVAYQQSMKAFLNSFVSKDGNQIVINRSFLDKAFQNAKPFANVLNDESCNRSVLSQQMITSTPIGKHEIKKPSPSTPKSVALEWKLKNLNALLEAAQSENISQDREIERLLQHVKELQEEKKMYQAKINILQLNETCACGNDLTNLPNPSSRITEQLQKQLESKDSVIEQLQEELSKLKESISTEMERYMTMKKQYGMLQEDNQRMKLAAEELKEEITMKETCNQNLFEIVKDLRRFISENHVQGAGLMESLESTFEFLDQSFKNMASDDSQGYDSENLASTVVDIKLKEKEHELEAMTKKTQELEHDLQAMTEDLNRQLERDKTLIKDLSCQMELQKQINLELSQKTVELRQALAEAEKDKSQLTEDLEKNKASVKDLSSQLAELDQKTAELQQALANTERGKLLLADDIEEFKAKVKELQSQLEEKVRVQIELNEKNIGLLQALAESEKGKSQLLDDLGKEKSKTADLNRRLEQVEKTKAFHEQSYANVSDEMVKQISALQLHLDQEKEKSDEINCQYVQVRRQADDLDKQCTKLRQKLAEDQNEIANLQQQLAAKDAKLNELCALHEEKEKSARQYAVKGRQQADDLDKQSKDAKLNELCALHEEKVKQLEKSCKDGEIFAMKLFRARHALTEKEELWAQERSTMAKVMEEKLRDARIEHDSKMAKMKDRMVELHKEGKTKLESDVQGLLLTVDGYKRKVCVENLEVRCAKLQQQLAEMNERNLEVRKENQLLQIRIKSMDEFGNDRKSVLLPSQANLRNNFKMEDEEGELFNNMYLADLKSGRCVSPGPSTSNGGVNRFFELSQRNSMVLPHLRTNYVALEPDCDPPQDDTRENMSTTFDDSSTGLISRRKVSGITSYKRPGPPTPSKRAGRLSLTGALSVNGGGEVQYKEVLRDANANVAVTSGGGGAAAAAGIVGSAADSAARTRRTKTPGKFKQMISSSSLLNNFQRDEVNKQTFFPYYI
uniref:Uncharacterized protein n=1 Tax=Anopheles stephensi TaxID=30069 RepID=A0A182YK37_ANOST